MQQGVIIHVVAHDCKRLRSLHFQKFSEKLARFCPDTAACCPQSTRSDKFYVSWETVPRIRQSCSTVLHRTAALNADSVVRFSCQKIQSSTLRTTPILSVITYSPLKSPPGSAVRCLELWYCVGKSECSFHEPFVERIQRQRVHVASA